MRTGNVWRWFMQNREMPLALERVGLHKYASIKEDFPIDDDLTFFHTSPMKKRKTSKAKTERPQRVHLTKEEVLERMKTFSERKERFLATARTGKS